MIRNLLIAIAIAIGVSVCWATTGVASTTPPAAPEAALTLDPFAGLATVSTSIVQVHFCTCAVIWNCKFREEGFDCAEPPGCCHCSGPGGQRICVSN